MGLRQIEGGQGMGIIHNSCMLRAYSTMTTKGGETGKVYAKDNVNCSQWLQSILMVAGQGLTFWDVIYVMRDRRMSNYGIFYPYALEN